MNGLVRIGIGLASLAISALVVFETPFFIKKTPISPKTPTQTETVAQVEHTAPQVIMPDVIALTPQDGASGVLLDIEDPIVVKLNQSAKDFFVDVRLSPEIPVMYENNADKTVFKILPKQALLPETAYSLQVFIKQRDRDDTAYVLASTSSFVTAQEKQVSPVASKVNEKSATAAYEAIPAINSGRYIDVSLAYQTMVLFEDGKSVDTYKVSSGKRGMETPKGQFKVENKARKPWSKQYSLYMPYWMAITPSGKFGIHELPEWPSGYKEGANHLGIPVSHGCVRLGVGAAKRVWEFADIGTPVVIH